MGADVDVRLNYRAMRAATARFGWRFDGFWQRFCEVLTVLLLLGGAGVLVAGVSAGWLVIGCAAAPFMLVAWYKGELKHLPPSRTPKIISDVLAGELLGQLPEKLTPKDIALGVGRTTGGQFFGARFGLTANIVQELASTEGIMSTEAIFAEALKIRDQLAETIITPGMVLVAIVRQFPDYNNLLAQVHIDDNDLLTGLKWQQHLKMLIAAHSRSKRTGGIGRDWSFGYIPLLSRFGQNISEQIARGGLLSVELDSHQKALTQLVETFGTAGKQNAALVGPDGVGKTTIVHAFAEKLLDANAKLPSSLKFRQVFMLDAASLIAAAPGRGELEDLVMNVFGEAFSAKNIILCLDNAQNFFEEGVGSVDLTNVLLPILEAGRLRIILTMDEQRYLQIAQRGSGVTNALSRISVAAANEAETMAVMQDQLILTEFSKHVTYTYQSLREAYRLSERYVHDLAMPGRALKLLESAASFSENGLVTINSVQQAIEQTMDIKVGVASNSAEREKLLDLEKLIHERMINQTRAVQVVSDALRRARAGVRNEQRPIGTFLFLGPTGVGKTELSKALADVYFGGEDRLIRLDLNEFVRPEDVARLIADGANDPSSLTAQVMKQPFSVILLDEIEKAAPEVLTTLLQLLDEGILRDAKNREISFRDAIIIATSNAGADRIREYIQRGYKLAQFEEQFTNELITSGQFKPEFLNRFDEIVLFTPLGKRELLEVIDLIIAGVNKTLSPQKITVVVDDDAKALLVERGYDPQLGARPMRRVVQKAVENTVAREVLSGNATAGDEVRISAEQVEAILGAAREAQTMIDAAAPES